MSVELYLAYVAATLVLLIIPGPTILLVVSYALSEGRRAALASTAGVVLGDLTAMVMSLAGLGALMAASATAFTIVKWIGAAYLVWLGIKMWRAKVQKLELDGAAHAPRRNRDMLVQAWIVTALNPKGIVFFIAFLPQFLVHDAPVLPQFVLLGGTFLVLAGLNALVYALMAGSLRRRIANPRGLTWVNRIGGSVLIGAGAVTAGLQRSA